jgi:hypothetical protein
MNPYKTLSLDVAFKEALFELGATDRKTNAVSTSELARFMISKGFPKKGGRTYQDDEHLKEVAIDLASMARIRPMKGWHHFVGGHASEPWNNWEWCIAPEALAEREAVPAPDKRAATKVAEPEAPKEIADMDRNELIAFIESRGGEARTFPPTKNARLREIALGMAQGQPAIEPVQIPVVRSAADILASIPKVHMA